MILSGRYPTAAAEVTPGSVRNRFVSAEENPVDLKTNASPNRMRSLMSLSIALPFVQVLTSTETPTINAPATSPNLHGFAASDPDKSPLGMRRKLSNHGESIRPTIHRVGTESTKNAMCNNGSPPKTYPQKRDS